MMERIDFEKLSRDELLKILDMYAKNWLAIEIERKEQYKNLTISK